MNNKNQIYFLSGLVAVALLAVGGMTYFNTAGQNNRVPVRAQEAAQSTATLVVQASPTTDDCLSSIIDGEQTNADCPSSEGSVVAQIAQVKKLDTDCSSIDGVVKQGSQCVLTKDITLTDTLSLESFTKLNCQGHKILPTTSVTITTAGLATTTSVPSAAIAVANAFGTKIQNCVIGDVKLMPDGVTVDQANSKRFSFGIFLVDSMVPNDMKNEPGALALLSNNITGNTIDGIRSILNIKASDTKIKDNTITGSNIMAMIFNDSDRYEIKNNTFTQLLPSARSVQNYPGAPVSSAIPGTGLWINYSHAGVPIITWGVGEKYGQIFKVAPGSLQDVPGEGNTVQEGGIVDGNTITIPNIAASTNPTLPAVNTVGILHIESDNTKITNNIINTANTGIRVGGLKTAVQIPGICSAIPNESAQPNCSTASDCTFMRNAAGLPPVAQTCSPITFTTAFDFSSKNVTVEGNQVKGPYTVSGIFAQLSKDLIIKNNVITGTNAGDGLSLGGEVLENGTVTGNTVTNSNYGVALQQIVRGSCFRSTAVFCDTNDQCPAGDNPRLCTATLILPGAATTTKDLTMSLNDFTGSVTKAIRTVGAYTLPTELSANGKGNFWGHTTCPGFSSADTPDFSLIKDSFPYITPVAATGTGTQCPPAPPVE